MRWSGSFLLAMGLVALPVMAGPGPTTPFAVQVTVSLPQGDLGNATLMDGKLAYGVGFRWELGLADCLAIAPRMDYTRYTRENLRAHIVLMGADLNWYPGQTSRQGFYLLAGLGYSAASFSQPGIVAGQGLGVYDPAGGSASSFYLDAGFGGKVDRNIAVEFRYVGLTKYHFAVKTLSAPSANASVAVRF